MYLFKMSEWRGIGKKYRWKPVTVYDVRSMLHTEDYMLRNILK